MTVGEMNKWNKRFIQIISAAQTFKEKRLIKMKEDLEQAYKDIAEPFADYMIATIDEELEG